MKKVLLLAVSLMYIFLAGCQNNNTSPLFTIQPKTSNYYTSISSGSNGPAFQLLTVYNNASTNLNINNISFTNPNPSITIANRSATLNQNDLLYGALPQCSTQASTTAVNTLQPGQTCGILLQGFTYDPRNAVQNASLNVGVSFGGNNGTSIEKTFNLTDVTHVYASPNTNKIGTVTVPPNDFVLADCSNSTNTAGLPLTCTNALGTNANDNFLNSSAGEIRVFPNGNLIFGGIITQAGAFQAPSSTASSAIICQTDSDQCQNALADGTYFGPQIGDTGFISEIELNPNTNNSTFFVTGKFINIMNGNTTIAHGDPTVTYPYFVAYCTIGGSCANVIPNQSVSPGTVGGDNGIYGLAYAPKENIIYFAGGFSNFTGTTNPGNTFPIIACSLNSNNIASSCTDYFSSSSDDSTGDIFGLTAATIDGQNELEANTASQSIGGQTIPSNSDYLAALCTTTGCIKSVTATNGITLRGAYDAHPAAEGGLFYIATNATSLGNANSTDNGGNGGGFLPACLGNDLSTCFDVLGGGTNGAFNNGIYPAAGKAIVANVGAQLSMTTGS